MPLIPDEILAEIRARLPMREVVGRVVPLRRAGRRWKACCPFHGEKSPSFVVYEDHAHCFGCGFHGDQIAFVMRCEGIAFHDAAARLAGEAGVDLPQGMRAAQSWQPKAPQAPRPPAASRDDGADRRIARAWRIWDAAAPLADGGPAARYLAGRGLWPVPDSARAVMREARLVHDLQAAALIEAGAEVGEAFRAAPRHPCLVMRVDGPDGAFRGVHRIYLAEQGGAVAKLRGVEAKLALGVLPGGAIRFFPSASPMGVAEGPETALAAARLTGLPVWSCIAANFLEAVQLPFEVEEVVIFADNDPPKGKPEGTGLRVARALATRLQVLAVRSEIRVPLPPAKDYADVLAMRAPEAAA